MLAVGVDVAVGLARVAGVGVCVARLAVAAGVVDGEGASVGEPLGPGRRRGVWTEVALGVVVSAARSAEWYTSAAARGDGDGSGVPARCGVGGSGVPAGGVVATVGVGVVDVGTASGGGGGLAARRRPLQAAARAP